jgi:hypothetical protein
MSLAYPQEDKKWQQVKEEKACNSRCTRGKSMLTEVARVSLFYVWFAERVDDDGTVTVTK